MYIYTLRLRHTKFIPVAKPPFLFTTLNGLRESSLLNGSLQDNALRGVLCGVHAGFACILAVTRLGRMLSGVKASKRRNAKVPTSADTSSKVHPCPPNPRNVGRKSGLQRIDRPISDSCTGNGRKRAFLGQLWSDRDSILPTTWRASLLSGMIRSCKSTIHETTCKEKQPQHRASGQHGWLSFWRRHVTSTWIPWAAGRYYLSGGVYWKGVVSLSVRSMTQNKRKRARSLINRSVNNTIDGSIDE